MSCQYRAWTNTTERAQRMVLGYRRFLRGVVCLRGDLPTSLAVYPGTIPATVETRGTGRTQARGQRAERVSLSPWTTGDRDRTLYGLTAPAAAREQPLTMIGKRCLRPISQGRRGEIE